MRTLLRLLALPAAVGALLMPIHAAQAQLLITGNDEKVSFDENTGKVITHPAGKDTVSIIDIADPAKPKIVATSGLHAGEYTLSRSLRALARRCGS